MVIHHQLLGEFYLFKSNLFELPAPFFIAISLLVIVN